MEITILSMFGAISPHLETELELAQIHLDQGDRVTMIYCDAALSFCAINPKNHLSMCRVCHQGRKVGIGQLNSAIEMIPLSSIISSSVFNLKQPLIPEHFETYESLLHFEMEGLAIGAAVMSSLNYISEHAKPSIVNSAKQIQAAIRSGLGVYYGLLAYLSKRECDRCYIFNGRFAEMRGAIWACQEKGITFYTHERGHDLNSYLLIKNSLPQDTEYIKNDLDETVQKEASTAKQASLAKEFYQDRQRGIIDNWHSFTDSQTDGTLPPRWTEGRNRIVVFTSTEAEMASLPEFYGKSLYPTQREGLLRLISDLGQRGFDGVLVIRMHPNSKEPFNLETDLKGISHDFVDFIKPDSQIDSYALLHSCDKVVSFGSTLGIEAVYWGKPSILLGPSIYEHLGGTYNPSTHEELIELVLKPLSPKSEDAAVKFGYYQKTFGTSFIYANATDLYEADFKGKRLNVRFLNFYLRRIKWIIRDVFADGYIRRRHYFATSGLTPNSHQAAERNA
jgi:hypothetical protein